MPIPSDIAAYGKLTRRLDAIELCLSESCPVVMTPKHHTPIDWAYIAAKLGDALVMVKDHMAKQNGDA